jgi:hypothetical protein
LAWARHSDFEEIWSNNHARRRPVNAVPAQNLNELIAYAKANPGKLRLLAVTSPAHLTAAPELPIPAPPSKARSGEFASDVKRFQSATSNR